MVLWGEVFLSKNTPSAFDQMLEEDPKTNRLVGSSLLSVSSLTSPYPYQYDSAQLWKEVVSNKHLQRTNLILFLNKFDIFQQKLAAGVRFSDHVTSYGDRENDFQSISGCKHFPATIVHLVLRDDLIIHRFLTDLQRKFGAYCPAFPLS